MITSDACWAGCAGTRCARSTRAERARRLDELLLPQRQHHAAHGPRDRQPGGEQRDDQRDGEPVAPVRRARRDVNVLRASTAVTTSAGMHSTRSIGAAHHGVHPAAAGSPPARPGRPRAPWPTPRRSARSAASSGSRRSSGRACRGRSGPCRTGIRRSGAPGVVHRVQTLGPARAGRRRRTASSRANSTRPTRAARCRTNRAATVRHWLARRGADEPRGVGNRGGRHDGRGPVSQGGSSGPGTSRRRRRRGSQRSRTRRSPSSSPAPSRVPSWRSRPRSACPSRATRTPSR